MADASAARWAGRAAKQAATAWTLDVCGVLVRCVRTATGWTLEVRGLGTSWARTDCPASLTPSQLLQYTTANPAIVGALRAAETLIPEVTP